MRRQIWSWLHLEQQGEQQMKGETSKEKYTLPWPVSRDAVCLSLFLQGAFPPSSQ